MMLVPEKDSFVFRARIPNWSCYAEWLHLAKFAYSHPIVGGKVAQPPRANAHRYATDYYYPCIIL